MEPAPVEQLLQSCAILFGHDLAVSREFLDYIQLSGVKIAFRKRAMETHPDRRNEHDCFLRQGNSDNFHRVRNAYEDLCNFLKAKEEDCARRTAPHACRSGTPDASSSWAPSSRNMYKSGGKASSPNLYSGPLPRRRLLFGHFLYYSGLADWRTITRILIWQKTERPRIGELGRRFGMLKSEDISFILRNKIPLQPFGQTAQRLGMLSENQLRILIAHQQRLQKKFGAILLEKDMITPFELQNLLSQFKQHNAGIGNGR